MMTHADVIEGAAHCGRDPRNLHATAHTHTQTHTHTHTHTQLHTHTHKQKQKHTHTHTRTHTHKHNRCHGGRSTFLGGSLANWPTFRGGEAAVLEQEPVWEEEAGLEDEAV